MRQSRFPESSGRSLISLSTTPTWRSTASISNLSFLCSLAALDWELSYPSTLALPHRKVTPDKALDLTIGRLRRRLAGQRHSVWVDSLATKAKVMLVWLVLAAACDRSRPFDSAATHRLFVSKWLAKSCNGYFQGRREWRSSEFSGHPSTPPTSSRPVGILSMSSGRSAGSSASTANGF
jgi:hypothetical protein